MTMAEIFSFFADRPLWLAILLVLASGAVEIVPVKWCPWTGIAKFFGQHLTGNLEKKVDDLSRDITVLRKESGENEATDRRRSIILFGDELRRGIPHSEESFKQILADVDFYEQYCTDNPQFRNSIATKTIERILKVYDERMEKNDFL